MKKPSKKRRKIRKKALKDTFYKLLWLGRLRLAIFVLAFAILGSILLFYTRAAAPSILDYIALPGGQEVIVPNGTYVGGTTRKAHSDWLILRAQTPGGVTIDLADTGLKLSDGASKIIFVGFKFKNGTIQMAETSDIHFWYCDFTFPIEEWNRQFVAAGGVNDGNQGRDVRTEFTSKMTNLLPSPFRIRNGLYDGTAGRNQRIGIYGSDFHDVGDDAIFFYATENARFEGLRIWNVDRKNLDPGRNLGNSNDWFHNDGIQTTGNSSFIKTTDSWVGQKIQWASNNSTLSDSEFRRLWLAASGTVGQINGVNGSGKILRNVQNDIRAFANGQQTRSHDYFRTDFKDEVQKIWPNTHYEAGRFEIPATNVNITRPSGVTVDGNGRLTDINQVKNHPDNPANKWRAAHPYESYASYLEIADIPPPPPDDDGVILAASGSIAAPFVVSGNDVYQDVETTDPNAGGRAAYTFSVEEAGTYVVKILTNAPATGSDSIFLNIDSEPTSPLAIWDSGLTSGFELKTVSWRGSGTPTASQYNPKVFSLSQGTHTLIIRGRERNMKFQEIRVEAYTPTIPPPTASITVPLANAILKGTTDITVDTGTSQQVTKVEFYRGSTLLGQDTTSPYNYSWNTTTVADGSQSLTAKAYNSVGDITTSSPVNVTVDNAVPTTSLTAPVSNAFLKGTINLTATASDNTGVTKVEFYRGSTLLGQDITSPYNYSWNTTTVADDSQSLTTKAYDAAGNVTTSSVVAITIDNAAPSTAITSPAANALLKGTLNITANASDNTGVTKVELYIDGSSAPNATDMAAPYAFSWNTTGVSNGNHTLKLIAYDAAGNATHSSLITVAVDNLAPTTSITSPTVNTLLNATQTITANASDNRGVTKVEFYVDGVIVGAPDTTSPYSFNWDTTTASNALHSLTTKAYDAAGNVKTSNVIAVTVDNASPTSVSLTSPSNGSTVSGSVAFNATASDNTGVTKVEFYRGSTLLGFDTTSPYSYSLDTTAIANGSYSFTVQAFDEAGNVTTSSVVNVTVNNVAPPQPDTTPPTVSITAPSANATVAGKLVTITVNSSDNVGVTKVEFLVNGTQIGASDTSAPYLLRWDSESVSDGSHTLRAKAYDAAGNNTISADVVITVRNTPPPKDGDINNDGRIDIFDLSILATHFGQSGKTRAQGDLNGDSVVNIFDLSILATRWGS